MLGLFTTIISGVLSGGATGLLGAIIQRFFDLKTRNLDLEMLKLNHAQALALAQIESERANRRAEADEYAANRAAEAVEAQASERSLVASYENDQARYLDKSAQNKTFVMVLFAVVDTIRGLIRPMLTTYLVGLSTFMFIWAKDLAGESALAATDAVSIVNQIIATLLYLVTACTLWWFGSRPPKKGS